LNVNFITGGPAINDDAWHHVAVTTSGGYSEIFVDGVSVSAPVDLSLVIGTDSAFIGQAPDGTNQFQGEISDVRIYDVARGVDDIAAERIELQVGDGEGTFRIADWDLTVSNQGHERYSVESDDLGSVTGSVRWEHAMSRDGWQIRTETETVLRADPQSYVIEARLKAWHGDELAHEQVWSERIPRRMA
jgi:hypothetical protein